MMKQISILVASIILVSGCASAPDHPKTFVAPDGKNWVFSYISSPITGSIHLTINGDIVASGSHGLIFGNKARGKGTYQGHDIYFHSSSRGKPTVIVYVDGKEASTLVFTQKRVTQ